MNIFCKLCVASLVLVCVEIHAVVDVTEFTVSKTWFDDSSPSDREVKVKISCTAGTNPDQEGFVSEDQDVVFEVEDIPDNAHDCTITEVVPGNYRAEYEATGGSNEDSGDNQQHCMFFDVASPSTGVYTCQINNFPIPARIVEGIPTLGNYGMAILALLILGVGFVGYRRLV